MITYYEKNGKFKHVLLMQNESIAWFTNRHHALRVMRFLNWYEKRFGAFDDAQTCACQLHHSVKKAGLKIKFDTINF